MATIIDCGDGSFIAGDPPAELGLGQHWCPSCDGSGLEYGFDFDELQICFGCHGACVVDCTDTACPVHSTLHPQTHTTTPEDIMNTTTTRDDLHAREDAAWAALTAASDRQHAAYLALVVVNDDSPQAIEYAAATRDAQAALAAYEAARHARTASEGAPCPNSDHDGAEVPAERRIRATHPEADGVDELRCAYCAEGVVARLLRSGYTVTVDPITA
ncbi:MULTISPECIES: hypothetical protein [unclassified Microbacterium]|uniref:hypothetical protein n=1 Tax=unclassified Microbacterium TaxID=2609290 RepID=UPI00365BC2AD